LVTGEQALILPCLGRTERDVQSSGEQFCTTEDTMMVINASRGRLAPASPHLLSEAAIVTEVAKATLGRRGTVSEVDWDALAANYDRVRDHISRCVPGFEEFNERIGQGIFYLPNPARQRRFTTNTGKANFYVHPISLPALGPDQYLMTTIRSHDQFNTTIYGLDDRYRGIRDGRRVVLVNPEDIKEAGLSAGQPVDLISHFDDQWRRAERFTVIPYDIPRRCVATYFPEANALIPIGSLAEKSECPTSKSTVVSIHPSENSKTV
jgi:anaerobic selenocysteine-containing dehydrogenase